MRAPACLVLLALLALVACRTHAAVESPGPAAIRGQIEGAHGVGNAAVVQVYRIDEAGLATPDPFETVKIDRFGRFATRALAPGRYRVVLRSGTQPPSIASARIPGDTRVVLRPYFKIFPAGLVGLRVGTASADPIRCRLTERKAPDGIPDVREFVCSATSPAFVGELRPGTWALDLPDMRATTEIELARGVDLREMLVDPPSPGLGGAVSGVVRRIDGTPAAWTVVAARPIGPSGGSADRWGRYAMTDRTGAYRIVGIPPGLALLRVECREVIAPLLPAPLLVTIPPSGVVSIGFILEP